MVELQKIDKDNAYRENICNNYRDIRKVLIPGAADNLSKIIDEMIK